MKLKKMSLWVSLFAFHGTMAQVQPPLVFKSAKDIPAYLKPAKVVIKPSSKTIKPGKLVPGKVTITNRKKLPANMKVMVDGLYPAGMDKEFSIHASRFVNEDGLVILLAPDHSITPRGVYVLKIREEFKNFLTAPLPLDQYNRAILQMSWKITTNTDGTFYFASRTWGGRLGVESGNVKILAETERNRTKWIAYQNGWCNNAPIWMFNPSEKRFLARRISGNKVELLTIPATDALAGRVPSGLDLAWDFTTLKPYRNHSGEYSMIYSFHKFISAFGNDRDGDGAEAVECGGSDCNDADARVYPGNIENADHADPGKDDDCDPRTFGQRDVDGDGYFDNRYYNIDSRGQRYGGTDCDDTNPAIIPGAVKYISEARVEVCGLGEFNVEAGMRAVRQPNGTAIVIPR